MFCYHAQRSWVCGEEAHRRRKDQIEVSCVVCAQTYLPEAYGHLKRHFGQLGATEQHSLHLVRLQILETKELCGEGKKV
jgi:hypothetical protein